MNRCFGVYIVLRLFKGVGNEFLRVIDKILRDKLHQPIQRGKTFQQRQDRTVQIQTDTEHTNYALVLPKDGNGTLFNWPAMLALRDVVDIGAILLALICSSMESARSVMEAPSFLLE